MAAMPNKHNISNMECTYWAPKGRNTSVKEGLGLSPFRMRPRTFIEESRDRSIISLTWNIEQKRFVIAGGEQTLMTALRCHAKQGDNRAGRIRESSRGIETATPPKRNRGNAGGRAWEAQPDLSWRRQ